jgi:pilus assembly protein CpaF
MSLRARLARPTESDEGPALRTADKPQAHRAAYFSDEFVELKARVQKGLLERDSSLESLDRDQLKAQLVSLLAEERGLSLIERDNLVTVLTDEIKGFGPIQPLLEDPEVTEVMVNGYDKIFIERFGKIELTPITFRDEQHLRNIMEKMLAPTGRRLDESSPMVDARLPDGSRLNAIIRPIAVSGDSVTIRKFSKDPFTLAHLVRMNSLSLQMAEFLQACVRAKLSIVVSGGTGSGKTTTLNALSAFVPDEERIVTIEDAAELQLQQEHKVTLEARPPNVEGQGAIPIRALVRNALRMRPDRIIVGEVRGGEALDMLQALNTGHEGSLTTAHANSPRDCLARLETMVLMAGAELPLLAIRQQIASAVDVIVQVARLQDGSRKIVQITEVVGLEEGIITTQDLFHFDQTGVDENRRVVGQFKPTGIRPRTLERFERMGVPLKPELFGGRE